MIVVVAIAATAVVILVCVLQLAVVAVDCTGGKIMVVGGGFAALLLHACELQCADFSEVSVRRVLPTNLATCVACLSLSTTCPITIGAYLLSQVIHSFFV